MESVQSHWEKLKELQDINKKLEIQNELKIIELFTCDTHTKESKERFNKLLKEIDK